MYILIEKKYYRKKPMIDQISLNGFCFGKTDKIHKIKGIPISNLVIYDQGLVSSIIRKKIYKKYQRLLHLLPDLIISDEGDGESIREALNQIERFRVIMKNQYQEYLDDQAFKNMAKQLDLFQKEAKNRFMELQRARFRDPITRSSRK